MRHATHTDRTIPMLTTTLRRTLVAAAFCVAAAPATVAAQSTFDTFDAFVAAIGPTGTDAFDDLAVDFYPGPLARSAGAYAYSVRAAAGTPFDNLFALPNLAAPDDIWLSTEEAIAAITFDGFASDVFAIGGRFFATDIFGNVSGTRIRVVATDVMGNSVDTELAPASADAFFGIRFDHALASLTLTADNSEFTGDAFFATVNDLVLGEAAQAVPEPQAHWLLVTGAGLIFVARRRRFV